MSIVPTTLDALETKIRLQRIVRPTLHFNTDAPPQLKEQGIDQVRIISPNCLVLSEQLDEIDTKFLPEMKQAWSRSIDRQLPPDHLINKGPETLEEAIFAIFDPTLKRDHRKTVQRQEIATSKFSIPSEYTVALPDSDGMREQAITRLIPFKNLRDMVRRIDRACDLRLRAVDIWNIKPPPKDSLRLALS